MTIEADATGTPKRRGPKPKKLAPHQASEFVELLREGYGRKLACALMGASYRVFLRTLRDDPDFRLEVRAAELGRLESCELLLYQLATSFPCGPEIRLRAAVSYLGRRDRVDAARRALRAAGVDPDDPDAP